MSEIVARPCMQALNSEQKYAVMGSWFLGPKAENRSILEDTFKIVVDEIDRGRKKYFKDDKVRPFQYYLLYLPFYYLTDAIKTF
jgi:hypothetical protein